FGRVLRGAGIAVHPGRLLDVVRALDHVDIASRDDVYYACRALLVHGPEQMPIFDRAFAMFWSANTGAGTRPGGRRRNPSTATPPLDAMSRRGAGGSTPPNTAGDERGAVKGALKRGSEPAALADRDFATLTPAELPQAPAALARLIWPPGGRRTRR